jgi:hypothetical protein
VGEGADGRAEISITVPYWSVTVRVAAVDGVSLGAGVLEVLAGPAGGVGVVAGPEQPASRASESRDAPTRRGRGYFMGFPFEGHRWVVRTGRGSSS